MRHWGSHSGLRAPLAPGLTQTRPPGEHAALEGSWLQADLQEHSGTASSGYFTWGHLGCLTPRKVGAVSADAEHLEMRTNLTQTSLSNAGKTATRPGLAEQQPPNQSPRVRVDSKELLPRGILATPSGEMVMACQASS